MQNIWRTYITQHQENTQIIQLRKWENDINKTFPQRRHRWPTDTWIDAQHHSLPGKYKSKPQWDITSHLSEWLKLKTEATTDVCEDVEKEDLFCIAGGNANWCSYFGKNYGVSSKN